MADKDYSIKISEEGSDKVIKAFNDIDAAEDKATKGAEDLGRASEKTQGKMSKLGDALKAGAGAAAGAAAAAVGLASSLNDNVSEGGKKAMGALSAFAGVASAFGPWGQLVAAGASLASVAIGIFSDDTEEATQSMNNFNANTNPFLASWEKIKDAAKSADDAVSSYKSAIGLSGLSDKFILGATPDQIKKAQELSQTIRERTLSLVSYQALAVKAANFDEKAAIKRVEDIEFEIAQQENLASVMGQDYVTESTNRLKEQRDAMNMVATEGINLANNKSLIAAKTRELSKELNKAQAELEKLTNTSAKAVKQSWLVEYQKAITEGLIASAAAAAELRSQEQLILHQNPTPDWQIAYYDELDQRRRESADNFAAIQSEEQAALHQTKGDYDDFASKVGGEAVDALDTFSKSFISTSFAALAAGESFKEVANAALEALAVQSAGDAAYQFAKGLAYTAANYFFPLPSTAAAAAAAFASSAAFAAIAGGAALGTLATGGFGGSGGGGGSSAGSGGSSTDLGTPSNQGNSGPSYVTYIIQNTGVIGLDRDLDRRFAEGSRRENQRPGGIRQNRR